MHRDSDRHKLFSRRAAMLAGGKAVLLSTLVGRMYYLQVVESERYATLADENRINLRLLAPPRGIILDRNGVPLATNQQNYRVVIIPEQSNDIQATLKALRQIVSFSGGDVKRVLREIKRKRGFVPVTLRENLNWREVARIEVNTPELPGVMIDVGQSRDYPFGPDTAHILGYVAAVSEDETGSDPLLELPGFRIGKSGIEKVYDLALRGKGGSSQVEVNAIGRVIQELDRKEGQPGAEITLTLDVALQKFVMKRLKKESAAAVIMDVHTGEVLALASSPSFDSNAFNTGLSTKAWKALVSNEKAPLINKAISGQYSPGSTFKMVVALAALEKGAITPETEVFCKGSITFGDTEFHCWKRGGHGIVNLKKGITESCDVYFYEVARRTGIDNIATMAKRLGLGQVLGLELPGEKKGLIPNKEWKMAALGSSWQQGETILAGIGQGYILTTPLQLAVMTARLVNGGFGVKPRLTQSVDIVGTDDEDDLASPPEPEPLGISQDHLRLVVAAMEAVVNTPHGTAFRSRIKEKDRWMGGKTGTVQVRRISKEEREKGVIKNKDLPWKDRDHAIFVGFAPVQAPRYAAAVIVEHGGSGSRTAAPIVRDILSDIQKRGTKPRPGLRQAAIKVNKGEEG